MATKIGEYKGYAILYDRGSRQFTLENAAGEEVGTGKTQEEVEKQADMLSKAQFHFPIRVFLTSGRGVTAARITSINLKEASVWVVEEDVSQYGYKQRSKHNLRYTPELYERTEANEKIVAVIQTKREAITQLQNEIHELVEKIEKPITLTYFGLWGG